MILRLIKKPALKISDISKQDAKSFFHVILARLSIIRIDTSIVWNWAF